MIVGNSIWGKIACVLVWEMRVQSIVSMRLMRARDRKVSKCRIFGLKGPEIIFVKNKGWIYKNPPLNLTKNCPLKSCKETHSNPKTERTLLILSTKQQKTIRKWALASRHGSLRVVGKFDASSKERKFRISLIRARVKGCEQIVCILISENLCAEKRVCVKSSKITNEYKIQKNRLGKR